MKSLLIPTGQVCNVDYFKKARGADKIKYICPECQRICQTTKQLFVGGLRMQIKRGRKTPLKFCSNTCCTNYDNKEGRLNTKCGYCSKEIIVRKSVAEKSKTKRFFCSHSCAGSYNGHAFPKKSKYKKERPICKTDNCIKRVEHLGTVYCKCCIKVGRHLRGGLAMTEQTIEHASRRGGANKYDSIRANARSMYREQLATPSCERCNYNKHVEVCHKQPISSFPKNTLVSEVNKRENIAILCPNCHWEYDRGLWS